MMSGTTRVPRPHPEVRRTRCQGSGTRCSSYLHRHHLHQDGEVGEVSAAADGVAEVPLGELTALVGPDAFSRAGDTGERGSRLRAQTCWCPLEGPRVPALDPQPGRRHVLILRRTSPTSGEL